MTDRTRFASRGYAGWLDPEEPRLGPANRAWKVPPDDVPTTRQTMIMVTSGPASSIRPEM